MINKNENNSSLPHRTDKTPCEYLKVRKGFEDHVDCLCGPDIMQDSFFPCDDQGNLVKAEDPKFNYHVVCQYCGRIVDTKTMKVLGKRILDNFDQELNSVFD